MSLAVDTITQLITDTLEECKDVPHGIRYIDNAIGLRLQTLEDARTAVMKAEAQVIEKVNRIGYEACWDEAHGTHCRKPKGHDGQHAYS